MFSEQPAHFLNEKKGVGPISSSNITWVDWTIIGHRKMVVVVMRGLCEKFWVKDVNITKNKFHQPIKTAYHSAGGGAVEYTDCIFAEG